MKLKARGKWLCKAAVTTAKATHTADLEYRKHPWYHSPECYISMYMHMVPFHM
jgi:hypothetical protein